VLFKTYPSIIFSSQVRSLSLYSYSCAFEFELVPREPVDPEELPVGECGPFDCRIWSTVCF